MWQVAKYESTTFFSLRPLNATTSGGKTLLTPTPFAFKMALLDAAIRCYGLAQGEKWFPALRDLEMSIRLPRYILVNNTFVKILRPHKTGPKDTKGTSLEGPMGSTIAYRELVQFAGPVEVGLQSLNGETSVPLKDLLSQINYLGKRGGFVQFLGYEEAAELAPGFTHLNPPDGAALFLQGVMQLLDDCGPKMMFEHANIYSGKNLRVGEPNGRLARPVVLPYQLVRSSRSFSLYRLIER
jgi:hypothetical protein